MKLWTSAAPTPYGNEYGMVAVLAETREEAIAKTRAVIETALATENYVPRQRYAQGLLDNLDAMSEAPEVLIDWTPAERRR
jgi:hypothetical protein